MTKLIDNLDQVLPAFEKWYKADHGPNEDIYATQITKKRLLTISDAEIIDFFVEFRRTGGHIQSNGERGKNTFKIMLQNNVKNFRNYILEPFDKGFKLKNWIDKIGDFNQWGFGIATIYLVRINKNKYPVLNKKTINALQLLGFENVKTTNWTTYSYVHDIQKRIINRYSVINNYYKADALCHYIYGEDEGRELVEKITSSNTKQESIFIDELEQDRASNSIKSDKELLSDEQLLERINEIDDKPSEEVSYSGKSFKRDVYKIELIKRLREYKCQFCGVSIIKKDGSSYIEACHIKPKSEGGNESLSNILTLCPNCHKEFDLGDRKEISHSRKKYVVEVNGKQYSIAF